MELELRDRVAIVTGASRGIGLAVARLLAKEGAKLALVARQSGVERTAEEIRREHGVEVEAIVDLATAKGALHVVERTSERFGRVDVLVNNAGAIRAGAFLTSSMDDWLQDWTLKPIGYARLAQAVFPHMKAAGGGRIINVSGVAARNPSPHYLAGGAANAAVANFTKGLADLGAPLGILVNCVAPGATRTERLEELVKTTAAASGRTVEQEWAARESAYPLGRLATAADVADLVCFLASARASFISGACITIDGAASRGVYL